MNVSPPPLNYVTLLYSNVLRLLLDKTLKSILGYWGNGNAKNGSGVRRDRTTGRKGHICISFAQNGEKNTTPMREKSYHTQK